MRRRKKRKKRKREMGMRVRKWMTRDCRCFESRSSRSGRPGTTKSRNGAKLPTLAMPRRRFLFAVVAVVTILALPSSVVCAVAVAVANTVTITITTVIVPIPLFLSLSLRKTPIPTADPIIMAPFRVSLQSSGATSRRPLRSNNGKTKRVSKASSCRFSPDSLLSSRISLSPSQAWIA